MIQAITSHLDNATAILTALASHTVEASFQPGQSRAPLNNLHLWQEALVEEFGDIVSQPSHDFSMASSSRPSSPRRSRRPGGWIDPEIRRPALPKRNLGVLEGTGTWIVDDPAEFAELRRWSPAEISGQIRRMLTAVSPLPAAVTAFESALPEVPPC